MINELRVGDYIENLELASKREYDDVIDVFKQWGFDWGYGACDAFSNFKSDNPIKHLINCHDGLHQVCSSAMHLYAKRKLTYNDIMSLKKHQAKDTKVSIVNRDIEQATKQSKKDGNKYHREIIGFCGTKVEVDVYRVLDAFKTESPSIDHAIKKLLCTGSRGHKDYLTDLDNAIESLQEARLLHLQKQDIELS